MYLYLKVIKLNDLYASNYFSKSLVKKIHFILVSDVLQELNQMAQSVNRPNPTYHIGFLVLTIKKK